MREAVTAVQQDVAGLAQAHSCSCSCSPWFAVDLVEGPHAAQIEVYLGRLGVALDSRRSRLTQIDLFTKTGTLLQRRNPTLSRCVGRGPEDQGESPIVQLDSRAYGFSPLPGGEEACQLLLDSCGGRSEQTSDALSRCKPSSSCR